MAIYAKISTASGLTPAMVKGAKNFSLGIKSPDETEQLVSGDFDMTGILAFQAASVPLLDGAAAKALVQSWSPTAPPEE